MKAKCFSLSVVLVAANLVVALMPNPAIAKMIVKGCPAAVMVDGKDGIIIARPPPDSICNPGSA